MKVFRPREKEAKEERRRIHRKCRRIEATKRRTPAIVNGVYRCPT